MGVLAALAVLAVWGAVCSENCARAVELTPAIQGQVQFEPSQSEGRLPERFRMTSHAFSYAFQPLPDFARYIRVGDLTFPSAITSESERNNTVHCEYYQPKGEGPFPGVIVLHILGGDFALSRLFANTLSQHGVAALFLKMPYYGPRRGSDGRRMISVRPDETVEGMTQAVLDIRRATAWLGARPEVDETELGLFGISLGGITGALAATAEPRLKNLCLLLAGGDIGEVTWTARETRKLREQWTAAGGTKEQLVEILKAVDPVTYADRLPLADRRILMLNATDDEVVPKRCTLSLWESFGRPPIEWYAGGHYTVARHLLAILMRVPAFFVAQKAFPGKVSEWNGYPRYDFEVDGKMVTVVAPKQAAPGRPWVWHGEFFGHKPDPDIALLGKGFHIVYMRVPDMLGAPRAVAHWNRLYDVLTKQHGLAKRAALVGLSRGGLYCYNWAAANPDKVACIYGDAPVCDFKSWPGGRGAGKGSQRDWALVLKVYEFKSEEQALAYDKNPVDNLAPLAKAGVPLLHVFGDADEVVPWEENTKLIADRYRALGGDIQLIRKPGIGHHPHGLKDSTPIVDFILRHAMGQQEK